MSSASDTLISILRQSRRRSANRRDLRPFPGGPNGPLGPNRGLGRVKEMDRVRVAILGAGIAGLAAANRIAPFGVGDVLVLESSERLGGKVSAVEVGGVSVDAGPDSFLTRNPEAQRLCAALGLSADLVAPAALGAQLWVRGGLHPLPREMALGVPGRLRSLADSGAVSTVGVARAALERILPAGAPASDVSVGRLLRPRFGNEVFESVVDPLLSGIYAGDADQLSAQSVVPHLLDALRQGRRLSSLRAPAASGAAFLTLRGGLHRLIDSLAAALPVDAVRVGARAVALERDASGYAITLDSGEQIKSQGVVLATPAPVTAALLHSLSEPASRLLATIETVPIATVTMRFGHVALPSSTGFLVPRAQRRLMVGCTFVTRKWPHLASHGAEIVRCAVGRDGDARWQAMDDDELVRRVRAELEEAAGVTAAPEAIAVRRFDDGIPQYRVGHLQLVEQIERELARWPRLALAGAAYRGVGVPACIASGRRAAEAVSGEAVTAVA